MVQSDNSMSASQPTKFSLNYVHKNMRIFYIKDGIQSDNSMSASQPTKFSLNYVHKNMRIFYIKDITSQSTKADTSRSARGIAGNLRKKP